MHSEPERREDVGMHTMRLDLATVLRRAQSTALLALSCATIAFPAIARADDAPDKGSSSAKSNAKSNAKSSAKGGSKDDSKRDAKRDAKGGSSGDSRDERTPSDDESQRRAIDEALLPSFEMLSVTGAPAGNSLNSSLSYRGRAGVLGALASGAVLATQFRSVDNMSVTSAALTSPSAGTPELGNVNAPIVNPEPGTVALMAAGLGVVALTGYRRRKAHAQP